MRSSTLLCFMATFARTICTRKDAFLLPATFMQRNLVVSDYTDMQGSFYSLAQLNQQNYSIGVA